MTAAAGATALAELERIARAHLGRGVDAPLRADERLAETVATDSLLRMTLLVETENAFSICVSDEEAMALETVGDLVALVEAKMNPAEGPTP